MVSATAIEAWRRAARLNAFAEFFEETASGRANQPDLDIPTVDLALLGYDIDAMAFWDTHRRMWGPFDNHYFASIPFRLEEECRLGPAILRHGTDVWAREARAATVYTLGAGAGTLSRVLAKAGDGRLMTLCCSPTEGNRHAFLAQRGSPYAHFFHGPFFDLDEQRYESDDHLRTFRDGYDVLLEDTTFQMYGADRKEQLSVIVPRIRRDGLLIQVHKILHPDLAVYAFRERQKDEQFKTRYFSNAQIARKRRDVLVTMDDYQVDLRTSAAALETYFAHSIITWNSGNFYTIVSSNALPALERFVASMPAPALPAAFCYEPLPVALVGQAPVPSKPWQWRAPRRSPVDEHRQHVVSPDSSPAGGDGDAR